MAKLDIRKIDKAMATDSKGVDGMDWYTADAPAFELSGFCWRPDSIPHRCFRCS